MELSASDDAEGSLISKMKQACGYEYTNKLQKMYHDIGLSKSLSENFRNKMETSDSQLAIDFRIKVLSHGSWPLSSEISVNLPIELTPAFERFLAFYLNQHCGRKLTLLHRLSKTEITMKGLSRKYSIKVSCK